jgi:hypothetical protein
VRIIFVLRFFAGRTTRPAAPRTRAGTILFGMIISGEMEAAARLGCTTPLFRTLKEHRHAVKRKIPFGLLGIRVLIKMAQHQIGVHHLNIAGVRHQSGCLRQPDFG